LTEADEGDEADANGASGAALAAQVLPPLPVVTSSALQGAVLQGEVPRAKPCEAEIKLTDAGSKCAGTGSAATWAPVANAAALTSSTVQAIFMVRMAEPSA
jgi:hypothetical protein